MNSRTGDSWAKMMQQSVPGGREGMVRFSDGKAGAQRGRWPEMIQKRQGPHLISLVRESGVLPEGSGELCKGFEQQGHD